MPRRGKKLAKGNSNNAVSLSAADLSSPLQLLGLDTPASISSLTASSSDLTPVPPSAIPAAVMDPHGTSSQDETYLPEAPPADVHSKLGKPSARVSATSAISSFHSAFNSSKVLQQVLGIQSPEPYTCPPPCPNDLEDRFVQGMKLYGVEITVPGENPLETLNRAVATEQKETEEEHELGKPVLERIEEEKESPASSKHVSGARKVSTDVKNDAPAWVSKFLNHDDASRAFTKHNQDHYDQSRNPRDAPEADASNARPYTAARDIECLNGHSNNPHVGFGSTTTLADSEPSRPGSSAYEHRGRTTWQNSESTIDAPQISSFAPAGYGTNHGADVEPPRRSSSLANLKHHLSYRAESKLPNYYDDAQIPYGDYAPQHTSSAHQPLFPSPRVEPTQSWDAVGANTGAQTPQGTIPAGFTADLAVSDTQIHYAGVPQDELSVPQIQIEPPSPTVPKVKKKKNKHNNCKRNATSSHEAPPAKARTDDSTLSLPVLSIDQEALSKAAFPGNTEALLTIILPWSLSMKRLFDTYPDPKRFSLNPAFPYKCTPPLHIKLISAAFYDLSVPPHKEIRFLGPADAVDISYNEVDIFAYPDAASIVPSEHDRAKNAMKRALGLPVLTQDYKHMPMHQRAATGEGRWAYLLIQGHRTSPQVTPPHAMIAWHVSTVTDSSDCMHFVYPDTHTTARPAPTLAPKAPRRFTSLQNLAQRFVEPKRLRQELRAASSEVLPRVSGSGEGAVVLKRRVVKMEKAGRIPLIEGYRVDVRKWEAWMEAVGRGKGKVIMWMEKE